MKCPYRKIIIDNGYTEKFEEFAESVKRYYSALPGATVGAAVRFYVDEKLKEALDKI